MLQLSIALFAFGKLTTTAPLLPKLRGYFAEFLNESYLNTLEYSSRPPVSVSGTITVLLVRGFSSQRGFSTTYLSFRLIRLSRLSIMFTDFPVYTTYLLREASKRLVHLSSCVTPSLNANSGAGIFNLLSIAYSYWPRLRYRLTLSG